MAEITCQDFDGTTGNLGRDLEGLEERGLFGTHAGVLGRQLHVDRGDGTSLGRGTLKSQYPL